MARQLSGAARVLEDEYARLDRKREALDCAYKLAGRVRGELDQLADHVRTLMDLGVDRKQIDEALDLPAGLVRLLLRSPRTLSQEEKGDECEAQSASHVW